MRGRIIVVAAVFLALGVFSVEGAEWLNYSRTCTVPHVAMQGDKVWASIDGGGAAYIDSMGNVAFYTPSDGLIPTEVAALACDSLTVWFGAEGGVCSFNGEIFTTYTAENSGLLINDVTAIAIDGRSLDKYIGTEKGLSVYDGVEWTSYTPYNCDLASPYVSALFVDEDADEVYVGTDFGLSVMNITTGLWRQYKVEHGMVANRVSCITKDDDGDIWIGTYQGVSRFDGANWYSYTAGNGRLCSNYVNGIAASSDGYIWVATDKGLVRIDGSISLFYTVAEHGPLGFTSDNVLSVTCEASGKVYFGTDVGLFVFNGSLFGSYLSAGLASNFINCVTIEDRTTRWIGSDGAGANRMTASALDHFDNLNSGLVSNYITDISSHIEAGKQFEWFGNRAGGLGQSGLSIFDGLGWDAPAPALLTEPSRIIIESDEDEVTIDKWICTPNDGVYRTDETVPGAFDHYMRTGGDLLSDVVHSMAIDDEHLKWFATGEGVSIFDDTSIPVTWSTITTADGLPSDDVHSIVFGGDDTVWFGTDMGVAVRRDDRWTTYQHIDTAAPIISDAVAAMAVEQIGPTCLRWFATEGGLLMFNGTDWSLLKEANSNLPSNNIRDIAIDTGGNKWFCTAGGVAMTGSGAIVDPETAFTVFHSVTPATIASLLSDDVRDVMVDRDNNKWFATDKGVSVYDDADWTHYTVEDDSLCSNDIRALAVDGIGRVFIGTANGFCVVQDGVVTADGPYLAGDDVRSIVIDRNGIAWIATARGVVKATVRHDGASFVVYDQATTHGGLPSDCILDLNIDNESYS
ncbi:hypothetical protein J7M28_03415 [bacterium]|nr:hypothetical protein [bacterium]